MGAKQSKRSVDISGKEAEGAGEVAAAGAGGEGRVEQLADADALKPQLNGDAHIHEPTEKEKELDSGTPENEKDATTEKENKEQDEEKDKDASPVSNGDGEQKTENGESATTPDDGKKPKKEKVKKKWSLRSISFSRKDKPKQEKKQKDDEPKTNGEPEKVPEETAEASPEPVVNEETEEVKASDEATDEKTPETPVTEPITNGSSTPESPKVEMPAPEETTVVLPGEEKTEATPEPVLELPINGLSLEETKQEIPEIENKIEEIIGSKPEETTVETTEVVPVPEIPVKKEVCVEQVPLIEPTPPPLPANPPPSSVASFAATTMAPELTDASLSNTTETAVPSQPPTVDNKTSLSDNHSEPQTNLTNVTAVTDMLTLPSKETAEENNIDDINQAEPKVILETPTNTLEINIENKTEEPMIETAPKEVTVTVAKIEITGDSQNEAQPKKTDEDSIEAMESKVNTDVDKIEAKEIIEEKVAETLEIKTEIKTETSENDPDSKEIGQDLTELLPESIENHSKEMEPISVPLDINLPSDETKDVSTVEQASTEINENSEDSEIKKDIPITSATNTTIDPPVVVETVDLVEVPPPLPIVPNEVDTQNDAMDEGNDVDTQETINPTSQIDSNIIESNMITDNKDAEIINTKNTDDNEAVKEDNINICKDPLGNIIETVECNGNIDNVDTAQKNIDGPTSVAPPAEDTITINTEAENEAETPDDSLPPSLSETNELMPAGDCGSFPVSMAVAEAVEVPSTTDSAPQHTPHPAQDPLPETVSDKMAEFITEVSPVPELITETETSSDVAVAN